VAGNLSVTPANLTITADDKTKVYGAAVPFLSATFTGFVSSDTTNQLTAQPVLSTLATAGSPVGSYPIQVSGGAGSNYAIVRVAGNLSVTPANLTITADDKTKVYGAAVPALSATFAGFVAGDTTNQLTAQPVLSTLATASSPVGSYDITVSGAAATNYNITRITGKLAINQASSLGALTSSSNPAQLGQLVTFNFQVSAIAPGAGTPTGAVQFKTNNTPAGAPVNLNAGLAAFASAALPGGTNLVTAEYGGDTNFGGITNSLLQAINRPPIAGTNYLTRSLTNGAKVLITNLLASGSDPDGDPLTFVSASATSTNGGAVTTNDGWVYYSPANVSSTNVDAFTYTITDGRGAQATGWVVVNPPQDKAPSPNLFISSLGNGAFLIQFDGIPELTYRIQAATNLNAPDWFVLGSVTADSVGRFNFTNTPPAGEPHRFYRSVFP
jgi:hypothetical protein